MVNLDTNEGLVCGYYGALSIDGTAGGVSFPAAALIHTTLKGRIRKISGVLETGQVRFTVDGTTGPTNLIGTLLEVGQRLTLYDDETNDFKAIRTTVTGSLRYHVYYQAV